MNYKDSALKLHRYLLDRCWNGALLEGPDCGIRFNYRVGRFVKSYLSEIPWRDRYCYVQAQGYWILSAWRLFAETRDENFREQALQASEAVLELQAPGGEWIYPNREWKNRVASAEGTWGAIALLESYRQTGTSKYLDGALRWHRFLAEETGYQRVGDELSINYFAHRDKARVPNNSAFALRFFAELASITGEQSPLDTAPGLFRFLAASQLRSGELPYSVEGVSKGGRAHYQCFQYNAFQCLDLCRYFELTADPKCPAVLTKLLEFLSGGLAEDGSAFYDCRKSERRVIYHAAALGAAFAQATRVGIGDHFLLADKAFAFVLSRQRADGSFPHSYGDYKFLRDDRAYPRNLAMILHHLLLRAQMQQRTEAAGAPGAAA